MTISDLDRLHSQLSRLEDQFPGYTTEIVEGNIVMSPVRPYHLETIVALWTALKPQLPDGLALMGDVSVPIDEEFEFCPDLAVIPAAEKDKNLTQYSPELIDFAAEVVSPTSVRNDYEVKNVQYARAGIPVYLIFDPYQAHCVTMWNPGPDGYRGRDTFPYGGTVSVETPVGKLSFDTAVLPVDRGTAGR
ncbi:Uma2 family endonuclease [Streptomyces chumphonensis]|uniref:Uma2 family endonuclease n=1 Tax=Streptomyces chumphonensis TaxID=1214925 RepID=A0A927F2H2_9ACTN|nr:Uma2 family endonuclease [Streptomyces chumphonensis]MBD3933998.1 Uma2 family endonuclease [Streptomyces chumphonensis]